MCRFFVSLLLVSLMLLGCNKDTNKTTIDSQKLINNFYVCKVDKIKIVNMSQNSSENALLDVLPQSRLVDMVRKKFKAVGGSRELKVVIDNAAINEIKDEIQSTHVESYYGVYDVRFRLDHSDEKNHRTIELAVHVENFRHISGKLSLAEKRLIIENQGIELLSLLEDEFRRQIPKYFLNHINVL